MGLHSRSRLRHPLLLPLLWLSACNGSCLLGLLPDGGKLVIPDAGSESDLILAAFLPPPSLYVDGGSASYGGLAINVTFDGGAEILAYATNGKPLQTFVTQGDTVTGTGDLNQDGIIDWTYTETFDGNHTLSDSVLADTDFDGVFDTQITESFDITLPPPNWQITYLLSTYVDQDGGLAAADAGNWVQQFSRMGSAYEDQSCAPIPNSDCGEFDGFPNASDPSLDLTRSAVTSTNIQILHSDSVAGACNDDQVTQLQSAFAAALEDLPLCLMGVNPALAGLVDSAVQEPARTVLVACSITAGACATVYAATSDSLNGPAWASELNTGGNDGGASATFMAINPALAFGDPLLLEETVLHELLHVAGLKHRDGPPGQDQVFGCARYCVKGGIESGNLGGCHGPATRLAGPMPQSPEGSGWDCADCATTDKRPLCGTGLLNISECGSGDCDFNLSTHGCPSCCKVQAENCFASDFESTFGSLCGRDKYQEPALISDCIESDSSCGDGTQTPMSYCEVNDPVDSLDVPPMAVFPCTQYPVGWCICPGGAASCGNPG